jgi:hypothetical protein
MHFASSVFTYVPQLKMDFARADNFQFTMRDYAERLARFWRDQVNVCIEPFYLAYKHKNVSGTDERAFKDLYDDWFRGSAQVDAKLSLETRELLRSNEQRSLGLRFADPVNQQVADAWRRMFSMATNSQPAKSIEIRPLVDAERVQLFEQFMADVVSANSNMFDRDFLNRTHTLYETAHADCLTNLKYTFYEQNCLLKLVVRYLLQRTYMQACPNSLYDPLTDLMDRVFWKPQEIFTQQ